MTEVDESAFAEFSASNATATADVEKTNQTESSEKRQLAAVAAEEAKADERKSEQR